MNLRTAAAAILCCCFLALSAPSTLAQADPVALVQKMYNRLLDPVNPLYDDLGQIRALASPELQQLIDREIACRQQGDFICNIDSSVLLDTQDGDVSDPVIAQTLAQGDMVEVTASFLVSGEPRQIVFLFRQQATGWTLTDVQSRAREVPCSLVEMLQQPLPY